MPNYGDLVNIISVKGKKRIHRVLENEDWHTNEGIVHMADIVAVDYGSEIKSSLNTPFRIQKPQLCDLIMGIKRQTQIMYPKDMGYVALKLGVGNGRTILEAGTGSGGFTLALSWFSGEKGCVHTFEAREEFHKLAKKNLAWAGLGQNVQFHHRDIANGFGLDEILQGKKADALFLDVRTPCEYLDHALEALLPGAPIAFLLPCTEQVSELLYALEDGPFEETEVYEILLRPWKPVPGRLRPADRMTAHTCFLVFTRHQECSEDWDKNLKLGTRERKQHAARLDRKNANAAKVAMSTSGAMGADSDTDNLYATDSFDMPDAYDSKGTSNTPNIQDTQEEMEEYSD